MHWKTACVQLFLCAIINCRTIKQKTKDGQPYEYDRSKEHKSKLARVSKHNLRKYKSEAYSADNIFLIYGTDKLVQDVKAVYHQEFEEALKVYNENQSRADRRIEDYFEHVANKEQDMAVEIIIQVGDRDYWQEHRENKVFMRRPYKMMLDELQSHSQNDNSKQNTNFIKSPQSLVFLGLSFCQRFCGFSKNVLNFEIVCYNVIFFQNGTI